MTKDDKAKNSEKAPTPMRPKEVTMEPEDVVHLRVVMADGSEVNNLAQAGHDGTVGISIAPEPAAPVQDPDPISDPTQMKRSEKATKKQE